MPKEHNLLKRLKQRAAELKSETYSVYLASKDPGVPWYARVMVGALIAYALSPIDLIPDFIPVIGYLDDLIIVPGGILLALKMIPPKVMQECRLRAKNEVLSGRERWLAAGIVLTMWLLAVALIVLAVT